MEIFKGIELIDYITVLLENIAFLKRMFLLEKYGDMEIQRELSRYFRDVIDRIEIISLTIFFDNSLLFLKKRKK